MPGNEFGEKIHNFFGQEGVLQNQHQSQVVDESWSNFSNGLVGNQKQIDTSLVANLQSYNIQQSVDPERSQSLNSQHGLNFTQQPVRSEYSRSLLQEHQQLTNGYMHGNLGLQTMPNEANFVGVDVESSRDRFSARGLTPDLHKIPSRFEMGDSPVNYDFFGGQQQLNTQLPGMLQPFPRQQMTFNDMQLLKQQVMVKQMHEYQMQQQLQKQQLEARQLNSLNSDAANGSCSSDNQSHTLINGIPLQDASSNGWQPDLMTRNTNWMHSGMSPVVQVSTAGHIINPENGQANLMAQQFQPSLYGMPFSGTNVSENVFSSIQMNRLAAQHDSTNRSPSITNQPTSILDQVDVQISHMLPRPTYQEKLLFSHSTAPGSNYRPNLGSLQQDDSRERNNLMQENFSQMEGSGLSEEIVMKVPENINASQKTTTLDPTEEKILFGSDDNLWEAFGSSTDMSLAGNLMSSSSDLFDACPSLQSGSWSALMQSAVAETSSDEAGAHGWANNNTGSYVNPHSCNRAHDMSVEASNAPIERLHSDSTRAAGQHSPGKGNQVSDHGELEKQVGQLSQLAGNIFHSSGSGIDEQNISCSFQKNEGIEDRFGIWKAASNPNLVAPIEQKNHFTQNIQMQRASYGSEIAGAGNNASALRDVQENIQQHVDKAIPQLKSIDGSQIHDSYASNYSGSNDIVNAHDLSMLSGGKNTQSGHVDSRPSISRKFQYHPMGNIDVTSEACQEKVSNVSPTLDQVSAGNQGYFGQPKSLGQPAMNVRIDVGPASQMDLNCTNKAFRGSGEDEAHKMAAKRVENSAIDPQKVAPKWEQLSPLTSDGLVRNGFARKELVNHMLHFGQNVSQSFSIKNHLASAGTDHQPISPQMAPSWYSQYGIFKNGLVQPMNDTGRFTPLKIGEQNVGNLVGSIQSVQSPRQFDMQQISGSAPGPGSVSSESLPQDATDELLKVDKPKKRKMSPSELPSWNKEVMQGDQRLKTLSEAEVNWARSTNRFAEKVEFETLFENHPPMRSKKRLIYATQLMQQLFGPLPARVISLVASTNYEFVAYTAARAALGDACSSIWTNRSEQISPSDDFNPLSDRTKTEKISDQYISKAAEDFICRTRKLETDFAGLENGTTITDLRVEVEDLEKIGVLNRFARFHPQSSSMDRTWSSIRLNPQRYVTIAPMPRNIPDMVQCLWL